MSRFFTAFAVLSVALLGAVHSAIGEPATIVGDGVAIEDRGGEVIVTVPLSHAVPWKVSLVDQPPRLILEFNDVIFAELAETDSLSIAEVLSENHAPDWSRLVAILREPLAIAEAAMNTDDAGAVLQVRLSATTAADFRDAAEETKAEAKAAPETNARTMVAIDPGHGGIDPGTEAGELKEADLMLAFANRLREDLIRTGDFDVVLTREDDIFVPLEVRLTRARSAGADIFLSLHADALASDHGSASGMTVYTLASDAEDAATERLTERHGASDILTGVDLTGAGDDVAQALVDLARIDTGPRAESLSATLIAAFQAAELAVNSRPARQGDFAVLKSADMPSVLIELGFLSSAADQARFRSEKWLQEASRALRDGLLRWLDEDRLQSNALRK